MCRFLIGCACIGTFIAAPTSAAPESRYTYDARGRLVGACDVVPTGATWLAKYTLDAADDRTNREAKRTDVFLTRGSAVFSPNGNVQLAFQTDGNLVVYHHNGSVWTPLWSSGTSGSTAVYMAFQGDGHLVLYTSGFAPVWSTNVYGYYCAALTVANDGNVAITDVGGTVRWQTNTGGH